MLDDVRVVEEGAADYGAQGRYDPTKLWFSCPSSCSVCCVRARGTDVDTSAGTLSEAKTQRRPHSARERVRRGGFPLLFRCFCIFLLSRARRHVVEKVMAKGGERVKRGGGVRRATA